MTMGLNKKNGKPAARKATKPEVELRALDVFMWVCKGLPTHDIKQMARDTWGKDLEDSAIEEYITKANKRFAEHARILEEGAIGKTLSQCEDGYARSVAAMQMAPAKGFLELKAKIQRLMIEKVEHFGTISNLTEDELIAKAKVLLAEAANDCEEES